MDLWEKLGGGMARVSVFDPRLNAGAYILKDLNAFGDSTLAGGYHESGKFSWGTASSRSPIPSGTQCATGWNPTGDKVRPARAVVNTRHLKPVPSRARMRMRAVARAAPGCGKVA